MDKVMTLACKDLRVLFAEKSNLFWVFFFPGMYALFFGAVFSGAGTGPSNMRVVVVDEDRSDFSQAFASRLRANEALAVLPREDPNAPFEHVPDWTYNEGRTPTRRPSPSTERPRWNESARGKSRRL